MADAFSSWNLASRILYSPDTKLTYPPSLARTFNIHDKSVHNKGITENMMLNLFPSVSFCLVCNLLIFSMRFAFASFLSLIFFSKIENLYKKGIVYRLKINLRWTLLRYFLKKGLILF